MSMVNFAALGKRKYPIEQQIAPPAPGVLKKVPDTENMPLVTAPAPSTQMSPTSVTSSTKMAMELPQELLEQAGDISSPVKTLLDKIKSLNPEVSQFLANHSDKVDEYIQQMKRHREGNFDEMAKKLVDAIAPTKRTGGYTMPDLFNMIKLAEDNEPKVEAEVVGTPEFGRETEIVVSIKFPKGLDPKLAARIKKKMEKKVLQVLKSAEDFEYGVSVNDHYSKSSSYVNFNAIIR